MIQYTGIVEQLLRASSEKKARGEQALAAGDRHLAADLMREAAGILRSAAAREKNLRNQTPLVKRALELEQHASAILASTTRSSSLNGSNGDCGKEIDVATTASPEIEAAVDSMIFRPSASFDDLGGMELVKSEIQYSLGLLVARQPDGVALRLPTRYLLFGPPGTGKTLLAAASSKMLGGLFFECRPAGVLSKFFGDSSRIVSALFERARQESLNCPVIIFIDEIDSLCRRRGNQGEHGAERRVLSTLLTEMDGLRTKGRDGRVLLMAATNVPWDLDEAVLRRFTRRLLLDLPDEATRRSILELHLKAHGVDVEESKILQKLAVKTDGLSGSELASLVETAQGIMAREANPSLLKEVQAGRVRDYRLQVRPLRMTDFERAMDNQRPVTTTQQRARYTDWLAGKEQNR